MTLLYRNRQDALISKGRWKNIQPFGPSCRVKSTIPGCQREVISRKHQRGGEMQRVEAAQPMPKGELEGMLHKLLVDLNHGK